LRESQVELWNRRTRRRARVRDNSRDGVKSLPECSIPTRRRNRGARRRTLCLDARGGRGGVAYRCCRDGNVGQVERGVRQSEAELVLHRQVVVVEVAVVDQEAFLEVGLPGVGVGGVEERAGVCDVCEGVVALLLGDGVGEVAGGVYGAVEDVDDAVAYFLAAEVGGEDCCDVGVVGETGGVGLVGVACAGWFEGGGDSR
jgi:hypothetical protein